MQWISAFEFRFRNRNKALFSTSEYTDLLMHKLATFSISDPQPPLDPFVYRLHMNNQEGCRGRMPRAKRVVGGIHDTFSANHSPCVTGGGHGYASLVTSLTLAPL